VGHLSHSALDSTLLFRNQIYRSGHYGAISGNDEFARKLSQRGKIYQHFTSLFLKSSQGFHLRTLKRQS
jgi:hypothetical protein